METSFGVGNTPLVELKTYERAVGARARIFAKLEFCNPAGSVKDRAALAMLEACLRRGIRAGAAVIEATSGNTGIALAAYGRELGLRPVIVMPETMSLERRRRIAELKGELVLTEGKLGMRGAVLQAEAMQKEIAGSVLLGQFENPANAAAHFHTTGPEIWRDTKGKVGVFVAGVGTGGTLMGAGRYLKTRNKAVRLVAVEPASSPVLSGGCAGPHGLQGIGAGFVPALYDPTLCDEVFPVREEQAVFALKRLKEEGIAAGLSSGAALFAAGEIARREQTRGDVVVLFADGGALYRSDPLYRSVESDIFP